MRDDYVYRCHSGYTPQEGRARTEHNREFTICRNGKPLTLSYGRSIYEAIGAFIMEHYKEYEVYEGVIK